MHQNSSRRGRNEVAQTVRARNSGVAGQDLQPILIAVARLVRTRGNHGELLAHLHTDFPERFSLLSEVWLEFPDRRIQKVTLEDCWQHRERQVLKFTGVNTISAAEELVGAWVKVPASQAVKLPDGTYYDHDLSGCTLVTPEGEEVGVVSEVLRIEGNNQLVVQGSRGEYLVPASDGICKAVKIDEKRIVVELPDGLMDLNE